MSLRHKAERSAGSTEWVRVKRMQNTGRRTPALGPTLSKTEPVKVPKPKANQ